jgi:hypothetical protein
MCATEFSVGQGKSVVQGDSQRGFDSQVRQRLRGDNGALDLQDKSEDKARETTTDIGGLL